MFESQEQADKWLDDASIHEQLRMAAGWEGTGEGYGAQAKEEWPNLPGSDFDCQLPEWLERDTFPDQWEEGVEYRTVLADFGMWDTPAAYKEVDGWVLVASYPLRVEMEFGENSDILLYFGEGGRESVYRRKLADFTAWSVLAEAYTDSI